LPCAGWNRGGRKQGRTALLYGPAGVGIRWHAARLAMGHPGLIGRMIDFENFSVAGDG